MGEPEQDQNLLSEIAIACWDITAEMAPYLLFGFAIAGLLHMLIRRERVEQFLGKPGLGGVVKGALIGVPMPLCSCSVIPVAASLRERGASRGATASFLSSTPQTGVDSILATYALMGSLFTGFRIVVAFVTGIVSGFLIDLLTKSGTPRPNPEPDPSEGSCCGGQAKEESCCHAAASAERKRSPKEALTYGFVTLPADLAGALVFGLLLAGVITALLPSELITGPWSRGPLAFLMATLVSVPLYVCATASIPMAFALIAAGLSPGAALVFLITGPATNTATIVTVFKMLGKLSTLIYLGSLLAISWLAGWALNTFFDPATINAQMAAHDHSGIPLWKHLSGVVLAALLVFVLLKDRFPRSGSAKACCHES